MGEHGWVGVRVGKTDAQVDHPSAPRRLGDQLGVVGGVGHGGHGRNQGVQEGSTAHIGQLAGVVELTQHGHRIGRLALVGQAQEGPPDGPMGWPVEVGLLEHAGDLGQQLPGSQDRAEHGLLSFEVVRRLLVRFGHRAQAVSGGRPARLCPGHRRGRRVPLPRRRDWGAGRR
jgi:hypothetical protein